jgi:AcrR family transcriptional regulator
MSAAARREVIERAATEVFAERGYAGASIDEIARRSGVTPPVVYDHFASKRELHRRLLERTRDELLETWREHLTGDDPAELRIPRAIDGWARYVQTHPFAVRMFFRDTTGDPGVEADHREVRAQARVALGALVGRERGTADELVAREQGAVADELVGGEQATVADEMAAEVLRSGLIGLALWWSEHPDVPREAIVATAMNVVWIGLERLRAGERWEPGYRR